jgi:hypothetical protein
VRFGEQDDRLATTSAALLPTAHAPLGRLERAFSFAAPARSAEAGPLRHRGECFNAKGSPGLVSSWREWVCWTLGAGDAGIPPICLPADRHRLGDAFQRTREPHADTPNLGETEHAPSYDRAIAVLREDEASVASPALEAWIARRLTCAGCDGRTLGKCGPAAASHPARRARESPRA